MSSIINVRHVGSKVSICNQNGSRTLPVEATTILRTLPSAPLTRTAATVDLISLANPLSARKPPPLESTFLQMLQKQEGKKAD